MKPILKWGSCVVPTQKYIFPVYSKLGGGYNILISASVTGVQVEEMSKLSWLTGWATHVGLILIFLADVALGWFEKSRLSQNAKEEGHKMCWEEAKVLQIEPNNIYRKYN
jgi:hypothetical protein